MWAALREGFGERVVGPQELAPPSLLPAGVSPPATPRLRAFYSGHSLTDGLPEEVLRLSLAANRGFDYEFQSLPGSTIRERTRGGSPAVAGRAGLRAGRNRAGAGLDVGVALRGQGGAAPYDVLVVTERHDLPYVIAREGSALHLERLHALLRSGNPRGRTWLAHSWLEYEPQAWQQWVEYESQALVLWECLASAVNRRLGGAPSIFVLPGGAALAHLVEKVLASGLPGLPPGEPSDRAGFLFRDAVHLSEWGRFYLGAVHYAALWGVPAEPGEGSLGLPLSPSGGSPAPLARALLALSWQYVEPYLRQAAARAQRPREVCQRYAAFMAGRFAAHGRGGPPPGWLRRFRATRSLRRELWHAPGFSKFSR